MPEIVAAFITGVFGLGAAVFAARWARSRSTGEPVPDRFPPTGNAQSVAVTNNPPATRNTQSDGVMIDARNSGQIIGTNNGSVSQTNYRDGKR